MTTALLWGIFLGLWTMVYSTQVNSVTQIPIKTEEDVLREAVTDGFLVEQFSPPSLKSKPLQEHSNTQQSNQTSSGSRGHSRNETLMKAIIEGSASSDVLIQPRDEGYSTSSERTSNSSTTLSHPSDWTSSAESNASQSSNTIESGVLSQADDLETFYSGSGNSNILDHYPMMQTSMTSIGGDGVTSSLSNTGQMAPDEDEGSEAGFEMPKNRGKAKIFEFPSVQGGEFYHIPASDNFVTPEPHKGHVTPDWIIILGFVVGVAALVLLCTAIATRDKWNGPRQASSSRPKIDSSQKQRAENEVFLQKDTPKINGKAAEYTVIPLDELPERYSH